MVLPAMATVGTDSMRSDTPLNFLKSQDQVLSMQPPLLVTNERYSFQHQHKACICIRKEKAHCVVSMSCCWTAEAPVRRGGRSRELSEEARSTRFNNNGYGQISRIPIHANLIYFELSKGPPYAHGS